MRSSRPSVALDLLIDSLVLEPSPQPHFQQTINPRRESPRSSRSGTMKSVMPRGDSSMGINDATAPAGEKHCTSERIGPRIAKCPAFASASDYEPTTPEQAMAFRALRRVTERPITYPAFATQLTDRASDPLLAARRWLAFFSAKGLLVRVSSTPKAGHRWVWESSTPVSKV